jgi:putative membrane protein
MLTVALVLAGLAGLLHVYIFWLEALVFEGRGRKVFGLSADEAALMKPWAYNQGFYNLFLAIGAGIGIGLTHADRHAGVALITLATGSMLAAALVLITSDPSKARAAIVQGLFPALALLCLGIWALG